MAGASMSPIRSMRPGTRVFYPDGVGSWMAKLDADVASGAGRRRAVLPERRRLPRIAGSPDSLAGR